MRKIIYMLIMILPQILHSQQISFNKDSLFIAVNTPNDIFSPEEFYYLDSLIITNIGQDVLKIDSIKTKKSYSYRIKIIYKDSVKYSMLYNDEWWINSFEILPGDSLTIIFADPDFCPICKNKSVQDIFSDKFYFFSNSKDNAKYEIDVQGDGYTAVEEKTLALELQLHQNYPNPFNPTTKISYTLPENGFVKLKVYNLLGKHVASLINQFQHSGSYTFNFDASNFASGVYIYSLECGRNIETKKMVLLK